MLEFWQAGKYLDEAIGSYQREDYLTAEQVLEQACQLQPRNFTIRFWQARSAFMQGKYEQAKDLFDKCALLKPQFVQGLVEPWTMMLVEAAKEQSIDRIAIIKLNTDTDERMKDLQSYHWRFRDFLSTVIFYMSMYFVSGELKTTSQAPYLIPQAISEWSRLFWGIVTLAGLSARYINREKLSIHFWIQLKQVRIALMNFCVTKPSKVFLAIILLNLGLGAYQHLHNLGQSRADALLIVSRLNIQFVNPYTLLVFNGMVDPIIGGIVTISFFRWMREFGKTIRISTYVGLFLLTIYAGNGVGLIHWFGYAYIYHRYDSMALCLILLVVQKLISSSFLAFVIWGG